MRLSDGVEASASVPQGKSCGTFEAVYVKPEQAVQNIQRVFAPALTGRDPCDQKSVDELLMRLDGTSLKSNLGANAILAVSLASARAAACSEDVPLWKYLRETSGISVEKGHVPRLYMNMINGGLHAGNNLDFQEYLIIPKENSFGEAVRVGTDIYRALVNYVEKHIGKGASAVGDEGGLAPNFEDNLEPFAVIANVVKECGLTDKIDVGLDAAANNLKMTNEELLDSYRELKKKYNIFYLEDPLGEDDFENFAKLLKELGDNTFVVGDDLTTTNIFRMERAHNHKSINGIIIKPNQIGTLSEAFDAVRHAKKWKWHVVVSHRSGETNDDFIADLGYAVGADGLKFGAPARGERVAKYNRLLEIERTSNS